MSGFITRIADAILLDWLDLLFYGIPLLGGTLILVVMLNSRCFNPCSPGFANQNPNAIAYEQRGVYRQMRLLEVMNRMPPPEKNGEK